MNRAPLDERQRRILLFVVESHVSRAEPVGSQYVRAAYHLSISPATIRNAMQQLEELGYLSHPHTSAGRVPTETGYRLYVDELMRPEPIGAAARRRLEEALGPSLRSEERLSPEVPRVLARVSRQLAVVAVKDAPRRALERAELIALMRHAQRLRADGTRDARLASEALERMAQLLEPSGTDVRIDGADQLAAQPEFQSPDRLRPLVALLADREPLARALEASAGIGRAGVSIGLENGAGPMRHCSLVSMRVEHEGRQGLVGVMGPLRMPYRRLVSLVSYVGERLSE